MIINCYIIDDDRERLHILGKYIAKTPFLVAGKKVPDSYESSSVSVADIPDIDILFINPEMLKQSGLLFSKEKHLIIFTSPVEEKYVKNLVGLDISKVGALSIPLNYERFLAEVERLIK